MKDTMNYTMLCDFYELTMGNGYFETGFADKICYFDVFFRNVPDGGGFAIAAAGAGGGLYQNLYFSEEDIAFLRAKGVSPRNFSPI
jgi:nicotinate phosphoribosyltransferase